jgi:hypothetical protein
VDAAPGADEHYLPHPNLANQLQKQAAAVELPSAGLRFEASFVVVAAMDPRVVEVASVAVACAVTALAHW